MEKKQRNQKNVSLLERPRKTLLQSVSSFSVSSIPSLKRRRCQLKQFDEFWGVENSSVELLQRKFFYGRNQESNGWTNKSRGDLAIWSDIHQRNNTVSSPTLLVPTVLRKILRSKRNHSNQANQSQTSNQIKPKITIKTKQQNNRSVRSDGRIWVWRTPGKRHDTHIIRSLSNVRRSVHFWGAITPNGTLPLIKADDHCKARDYVNIVEQAGVQNLSSLALKFVDDNCPLHRAKTANQWKRDNGACRLPWPAHSPDLNPIEKSVSVHDFGVWELGGNCYQYKE